MIKLILLPGRILNPEAEGGELEAAPQEPPRWAGESGVSADRCWWLEFGDSRRLEDWERAWAVN